jgi:hypothetical protein
VSFARVSGLNTTQAEAAKIKAKPIMSVALGRSPMMRTVAMTPIMGMASVPRDAVTADTRRTRANHKA